MRPLILDTRNRLYLYRYWEYENNLSQLIKKRVDQGVVDLNMQLLKQSIRRHFPEDHHPAVDWQKVAAVTAVLKKFCIITGGPGTGKTFTIAKILVLLLEQASEAGLEIRLAAPTGKAASRLQESIKKAIGSLDCSDEIKQAIPAEVYTIHRLLRPIPDSPYFRYNFENPIPADIVVVDEASMVDLAMMSKLVEAVPLSARLVLIGDKDQLASVEAGSVLGDICDRNHLHGFSDGFRSTFWELTHENLNFGSQTCAPKPGLQECIVVLQKSRRFAADSGIGALGQSVNCGDTEKTIALLKNANDPSVVWYEIGSATDFYYRLAKEINDGYSEYLKIKDPPLALAHFNRFKILCALKIGSFGVDAINKLAEKVLFQHNLIQLDPKSDPVWYRGRPILITNNDYNLGLFNGDIGITMPDPSAGNNDLFVFFPGNAGETRRFAPYRLPEHETVYAMTVHKSQGSEFDKVVLVLPDRDYPVLTRELVYTGLTRTRKKISIWATRSILACAISRPIIRTSGLREALWG